MRLRRASQSQKGMAIVSENHIFVILVALTLVYFLWMDLAMYYKLQTGHDNLLTVQVYSNVTPSSNQGNGMMAFYDPFDPIGVKLLMLDHLNHYIYYPLCWWMDTHLLHISDKLLFITPDMISLSHVAIAALGARLVISESLTQRRIGVVLFELRSMLDSYDGMVARARRNEKGMTQVGGSWGYWMDGVCDAVGVVFFFIAAWILLQRRQQGLSSATSSSSLSRSASTENLFHVEETDPFLIQTPPSSLRSKLCRLSTFTILALILQQFFGSLFWNRYMTGFHELLEVPRTFANNKSAMDYQVGVFKSSPFWIICWSWKLLNPHSMMSFLLCFVFLDIAGLVFAKIRYLGFVPLFALVVSSELMMQTIRWRS